MVKPFLGVFGGSGFYSISKTPQEFSYSSKWGASSAPVQLAEVGGKQVAFLPRHGKKHSIPPHKINYRANVDSMKQAGVTQLLGPFACGSLKPSIKPGDFVIVDQFVDRTNSRADTFFEGPEVVHIGGGEPYCPRLRASLIKAAKKIGVRVHESGTAVVVNGPRFSTRAESKWFSQMGWDVVTMTQFPEVVLAREAGLCYAGVALVTDFDVGLEGHPNIKPVTAKEVVAVFKQNIEKLSKLLAQVVDEPGLKNADCHCSKAVDEGRIG